MGARYLLLVHEVVIVGVGAVGVVPEVRANLAREFLRLSGVATARPFEFVQSVLVMFKFAQVVEDIFLHICLSVVVTRLYQDTVKVVIRVQSNPPE